MSAASDAAPRAAAPSGRLPPIERNELRSLASIERELPGDLALRVTALRWIHEVRPDPESAARQAHIHSVRTSRGSMAPYYTGSAAGLPCLPCSIAVRA